MGVGGGGQLLSEPRCPGPGGRTGSEIIPEGPGPRRVGATWPVQAHLGLGGIQVRHPRPHVSEAEGLVSVGQRQEERV